MAQWASWPVSRFPQLALGLAAGAGGGPRSEVDGEKTEQPTNQASPLHQRSDSVTVHSVEAGTLAGRTRLAARPTWHCEASTLWAEEPAPQL